MMAALEEEIAHALQQVGVGAAGADIPALLESIMGAMSAGAAGGGGGMMGGGDLGAAQITIGGLGGGGGGGGGKGGAGRKGSKDDDDGDDDEEEMIEVNLFGTKILMPKAGPSAAELAASRANIANIQRELGTYSVSY
eukprot:COSAG06_NODE_2390_length_6965_cov_2.575444_2_plen_138_part_00